MKKRTALKRSRLLVLVATFAVSAGSVGARQGAPPAFTARSTYPVTPACTPLSAAGRARTPAIHAIRSPVFAGFPESPG